MVASKWSPARPSQNAIKRSVAQVLCRYSSRSARFIGLPSPAKVRLLYLGISPKRRAGAAQQDAASLHDVGPIRDLEGAQRVLLDQQDRDAIPVDPLDDLEDGVHHLGGEAQRWFVQQQELGLRQQSSRDREDLLLASGELPGRQIPPLAQDREL